MTPWQRQLEERGLKAYKLRIKKLTKKGKNHCKILVKFVLMVLTGEASKGYKNKIDKTIKTYVLK